MVYMLERINDMNQDILNKFQDMADKLMVIKHHDIDPVIEHSIDGIASEAGELVDAAKRVKWYGTDIDYTNILEECGDLMFYLDKLVRKCGSSFDEVMKMNMSKLAERYNNFEFTKEQAVNRDLTKERKVLEGEPDHNVEPLPTCSNCIKKYRLKDQCKKVLTLKDNGTCDDHEFFPKGEQKKSEEQEKPTCSNCSAYVVDGSCISYGNVNPNGWCSSHTFKGE